MKLYDPLARIELKGGNYMEFKLHDPIGCTFESLKEGEVLICEPGNPFSPFGFKEICTMGEFLNKYGHRLPNGIEQFLSAKDIVDDYLKTHHTNMNYYTTKPTGGYGVQWKGSNLHEIVDLLPNTSAAIDKESGSLTLTEWRGTHNRQYFLHLTDWAYSPSGTPGNVECYNNEEFKAKFTIVKKSQDNSYGALNDSAIGTNRTAAQAGCEGDPNVSQGSVRYPTQAPEGQGPKMYGHIQG